MNIGTIVVLAVVLILLFFAVRSIYRQKKNGGCCNGDCSRCHGCSGTANQKHNNK